MSCPPVVVSDPSPSCDRCESVRWSSDWPAVQAALSGYSDWPMRLIARRHGAGYTLCEVMLDQFLLAVKRRARTRHFLHRTTRSVRWVGS